MKNSKLTDKKNNLKAIDFFCSAGGVTCGFKNAGIDVLGGIDIDSNCQITYEKNNNAKFLCADVSTLEKEKLTSYFNISSNQNDLIFVGCSPCQYYSNIKTNKTKSSKGRLLLVDFQEFVSFYKPGYVFIENVPGLDTKSDSPLGRFKNFLKKNGYTYKDGIINAKYYGIPQNRRRYILLASRVHNKIELPKTDKSLISTVRDAIGNSKTYKPIKAGTLDISNFQHSSAKLSSLNLKRIKKTKKNGGDRRDWENDNELKSKSFNGSHYDVYGRMNWDKPAPTITTRFISYSNGRYGHPEQNRAISIREGATLQSFPIDYIFYSNSQGTIAKMIGNAVPPKLAEKIGNEFINLNK